MKKLFLSLLILNLSIFAFSMPGFNSTLPDSSGQYVYYRDFSFERESYIGILSYDEATYQIRYYAPFSLEYQLPEKDLSLLLTVNPDSNFWDMTGERILSSITPDSDDLEILNYLHDILYEFSSRRIKQGDIDVESEDYKWGNDFWENGIKSYQDYEQFGGKVTIYFDSIVPLFNIKKIVANDGSDAFVCCIIGDLKSNSDQSFEFFKGFKEFDNSKYKATQVYKKGKSVKNEFNNRSVVLDLAWNIDKEANNICTLNNDAVVVMTQLPRFFQSSRLNDVYSIRGYLTSIYYSYKNLLNVEVLYDPKNDAYKITNESYQRKDDGEDNFIHSIDLITRGENTGFDSFELNVYKNVYKANSAYFDKIVKSYK